MNQSQNSKYGSSIRTKSYNLNMYSELFKELINNLSDDYIIYDENAQKDAYKLLQSNYPFKKWGRIDWSAATKSIAIDDIESISEVLINNDISLNTRVIVLWDGGDSPVIETKISFLINAINDLRAVSFDQWLLDVQNNFVIEITHDDVIHLGILD